MHPVSLACLITLQLIENYMQPSALCFEDAGDVFRNIVNTEDKNCIMNGNGWCNRYTPRSRQVRHEYEKRYGRCWPNRRKKFNTQRPGTNDELSQIRESSVVHDLDSTISSTGPLAALNRAPSSNSNGGYNFSNSTTSLRKSDFNGNTNGSNPFITRGLESNGSRPVVHTVSTNATEGAAAGTSGVKDDPFQRDLKYSEGGVPPTLAAFKGLSLKVSQKQSVLIRSPLFGNH